jgi:hypothetical protein
MKIALAVSAFLMLSGSTLVLASSPSSVAELAGVDAWSSDPASSFWDPLAEEPDFGEFEISQNSAATGEVVTQGQAGTDGDGMPAAKEGEGAAKAVGSDSEGGEAPEEVSGVALRRPLQFEFLSPDGRKIEGLSSDQLQVDQACPLLDARDDLEVLEKLAKCIKLSALGNYIVSGVPEVIASSGVVRFAVPVAINRFKTVRLEASMKDGSTIPVNCSPQLSLTTEAGFETILPMVESRAENRLKVQYDVEFPDYQTVSSTTFRIQTSRSSGCRLAEAELGLEQGKALGKLTLDEDGAVLSAEFVPSDPALLIVLTRGGTAAADKRLGEAWTEQASAVIESAFDVARQNFSQVIVAGYTENSDYKVFLKVPKTQIRNQWKKIINKNDLGFNIDSSGLGLDASLQVDLDQQIADLAEQGVSVVTVVYGREQSENSICDLGSLSNTQFMERLGRVLIIDVLPTKVHNSALKTASLDDQTADVIIVEPKSENFSAIDCVKFAGLMENRSFPGSPKVYALPLSKGKLILTDDYLELSRKWLGELLENAQ